MSSPGPGGGPVPSASPSAPIAPKMLLAMPNLEVSASAAGISGAISSILARMRVAILAPISPLSSRKSTSVRAAATVSAALSGGAMTLRG